MLRPRQLPASAIRANSPYNPAVIQQSIRRSLESRGLGRINEGEDEPSFSMNQSAIYGRRCLEFEVVLESLVNRQPSSRRVVPSAQTGVNRKTRISSGPKSGGKPFVGFLPGISPCLPLCRNPSQYPYAEIWVLQTHLTVSPASAPHAQMASSSLTQTPNTHASTRLAPSGTALSDHSHSTSV